MNQIFELLKEIKKRIEKTGLVFCYIGKSSESFSDEKLPIAFLDFSNFSEGLFSLPLNFKKTVSLQIVLICSGIKNDFSESEQEDNYLKNLKILDVVLNAIYEESDYHVNNLVDFRESLGISKEIVKSQTVFKIDFDLELKPYRLGES